MIIVRHALSTVDPDLPCIPIQVDRLTLQKRRWRATAADGTDFGIEVDHPLANGAVVHQSECCLYRITQSTEPVLDVALPPTADAVARLAWSIGNLHFPLQVLPDRVRVADDPALRQLFDQLGVPPRAIEAVFEPGTSTTGHHHHHHDHHHH
jgi:urease accessory protein